MEMVMYDINKVFFLWIPTKSWQAVHKKTNSKNYDSFTLEIN